MLIWEEGTCFLLVFLLELGENGERLMTMVRHELVSDLDEGIGRAGHGREDDDLRLIGGGDKVCDVLDSLGGGYGGTSKLHDLHYRGWGANREGKTCES